MHHVIVKRFTAFLIILLIVTAVVFAYTAAG